MSAILFLSCVFMISLDGARGAILTAFCVDLKWPGIARGTDVTRGEGSSASGVPGICGKLWLNEKRSAPARRRSCPCFRLCPDPDPARGRNASACPDADRVAGPDAGSDPGADLAYDTDPKLGGSSVPLDRGRRF